jgi:hypothetical protein
LNLLNYPCGQHEALQGGVRVACRGLRQKPMDTSCLESSIGLAKILHKIIDMPAISD